MHFIILLCEFIAAESEASSIDILVCGNCQGVFHYVEEFQEHKSNNNCKKVDETNITLQVCELIIIYHDAVFILW